MIDMRFIQFFDAKAVTDKVGPATRRVLSKAGAFVWRTARQSIRSRKRISDPGEPPSSHTGTLKRLIFFGYDQRTESVVVGPVQFRAADGGTQGASLLELGGTTRRNSKTVRYRRHAFMGPALEEESPRFPDLFRDSVG